MLTKEYQVEIEVLHRQGKGIREIARETGIARNTVRAVLRGVNDNQYGPRVAPPARLDAYKEYVRERIERAGKTHLSAMVLLHRNPYARVRRRGDAAQGVSAINSTASAGRADYSIRNRAGKSIAD